MSKPKEFWIRYSDEYECWYCGEEEMFDDDIHVIEKSAYDERESTNKQLEIIIHSQHKRIDELKQKADKLARYIDLLVEQKIIEKPDELKEYRGEK